LSEGIAVFYGGSNGISQEQHFAAEQTRFHVLADSIKTIYVHDFLDAKYYGGDYQPFFYAISGKLIANYLETHTELELKTIIENYGTIIPNDFIMTYLKIENPKEYIWNIMK
jgi:hypothetical protein